MAIIPFEDRYKSYLDRYSSSMNDAVTKSNAVYDQQKTSVSDQYQTAIDQTSSSYDDSLSQNNVQKYLNEYLLQKRMSSMGMTDSGLNRTQMTATQLSYANNKSKIEQQRQQAVDTLTREMTAKLADLEATRSNAEQSIIKSYEQMASDAANADYKADVDAQTELAKAALSGSSSSGSASQNKYYGFTQSQYDKLMQLLESGKLAAAKDYLNRYAEYLDDAQLEYWAQVYDDMRTRFNNSLNKNISALATRAVSAVKPGLKSLGFNKK